MCGVRTEEVSWNASFSGFDAGDFITAGPVTSDFCFQIRQTLALQRNAPVRTESTNPPAATVHPAGALHAGEERKCSGGKRTSVAAIENLTCPPASGGIILQARVHLGKVKPGKFTSSSLRPATIILSAASCHALQDECSLTSSRSRPQPPSPGSACLSRARSASAHRAMLPAKRIAYFRSRRRSRVGRPSNARRRLRRNKLSVCHVRQAKITKVVCANLNLDEPPGGFWVLRSSRYRA